MSLIRYSPKISVKDFFGDKSSVQMKEKPLVSVLMTAFNRELYIAEAIESVLGSSYENWELIIVDDGSVDRTVDLVEKFRKRDSRVKLYVNEVNLGDYTNRNKAASYASGIYLKYVDADDSIYPWGLALLVSMMELFPEAGWGLCSLEQDVNRPFPMLLSPKEAYRYNYFGPGLFHKAPLSSIIRRDLFEEVGGFNNIRMAGDFDMWHRLARMSNVVLMPNGIVWSREHAAQEMNHFHNYTWTYNQLMVDHIKHESCPLEIENRVAVLKKLRWSCSKEIIKSLIRLRGKKALDAFAFLSKNEWLIA